LRDLLIDAIQAFSTAHSAEDVGAVLRGRARALTGADGITFVLRDHDQCYYADEDAIAPLWKGQRFPAEACISGLAMRHGEVVVIPDVYTDLRVPHEFYRPTFVRSLAMIPAGGDAAIGAYWATRREATDAELTTLLALASASALAMAAIRVHELKLRLVAERHARVQAERGSRMKDEVLATLSHELRTPLNVVQGWLAQLRRMDSAAEMQRGLEIVERNVRFQTRLVGNLLDASRGLADGLRIDSEIVDLGRVCQHVAETVKLEAESKRLTLTVDVDRTQRLRVKGDAIRLEQIAWNLVANALKFTPEGGHVALVVAGDGRSVELAVRDTGFGIEPDVLPHVFEAFRRGDGGEARRFRGLGLGLALVKQIVELHGGTVSASSRGRNSGTTVTVKLPAAELVQQPDTTAIARPPAPQPSPVQAADGGATWATGLQPGSSLSPPGSPGNSEA